MARETEATLAPLAREVVVEAIKEETEFQKLSSGWGAVKPQRVGRSLTA
jgi:hypothetical protein